MMKIRFLRTLLCLVLCVSFIPIAGIGAAFAEEDSGHAELLDLNVEGEGIESGGPEDEAATTGAGESESLKPGESEGEGEAEEATGALGEGPIATPTSENTTIVPLAGPVPSYSVEYRTHVQSIGWQDWVKDGKVAGTTGRSLRVEAINIRLVGTGLTGSVEYRTHVQNIGWQPWVKDGATAGTTGRSLQAEAISIRLTGELADNFDIVYRVHSAYQGWLGWTSNGKDAGTMGYGYRMEAIEIKLVAKGTAIETPNAFNKKAMAIETSAHVQNIGWQAWVANGATAGTTGRSLRVEAVCFKITNPDYSGSVEYRAYVQGVGWQAWKEDGATAGTTGQSRQLEAIQIRLSGELSTKYDVYYRAHVAYQGWLGWAKDVQTAGTVGLSCRLEALQVMLVPKGGAAPGSTAYPGYELVLGAQANVSGKGWLPAVSGRCVVGTTGQSRQMEAVKLWIASSNISGSIEYNVYIAGIGWQSVWLNENEIAGVVSSGKQIEAIRIRLTGDLASKFDVYYRAHTGSLGWLGWAKNGANAGTATINLRMEAFEIAVTIKGGTAPGTISGAFLDYSTGDSWLNQQLINICAAHGNDLRSCFNYVAGFPYRTGSLYPTGDWAAAFARDMLVNGSGNCYRYAALFCCLAKMLGYDAKVVSGTVPSLSMGRAPHGWVEIRIGAQVYICDPCLAHDYKSLNWYMTTYTNAPVDYAIL